jgi:aminoglycoside/choline kinase family phosphotransferase
MAARDEMIACAREALALGASATVELSPLQVRGSDRSFFRLTWNGKGSAILILYNPNRIENTYWANIDLFLHDIGVPAPRLIRHDPARCLIVMEDLGDTDLWWFRESEWETRLTLYQKTLVIVHRLHSFPEKEFPSRRVTLMNGFDPDLYRWERDYFRVNFVGAVCKVELEPAFERDIEMELSALAKRLSTGRRCLLHRDLQSQNVMIRDGEPFLIDFQGMRFGNPLYDLGSLLYDPYVDFSSDERNQLLFRYYGLTERGLDWSTFRNQFWEASTQRLMQALGAYGFLGLNRGLSAFLEHVPAGLRNLQQAASHAPLLARLRELLQVCEKAMGQRGKPEGRLL